MSSEHNVEVVRLGHIEKHPNADSLSITYVGGRPVIMRTGEFAEGDVAVYVPVDAVVPADDPRWAFLGDSRRIRAKRLRGVFSMGLLTAPEPGMVEGDIVNERMRIETYEPPADVGTGGDNEPAPGINAPVYTDIESWRKWHDVPGVWPDPDEVVVCTEKIHGANARYVWHDGRLWCGSRTNWKREDPRSAWWQAAAAGRLAEKLSRVPGFVVYGEVYGQVQDLRYGVPSGVRFVAFDVLDAAARAAPRYLDGAGAGLLYELDIPRVPVLYEGPVRGVDPALANGKSVLAQGACIREGFVVRPHRERWHDGLGRVVLKLVGEDYHLRKGAK